ncbi:hypothetical protein K505DRAFT_319108 [Melanomma pulvis-pyrius CBS 109.77]|uniref:PSI domain-containing protein n=1 Tax=Melanomma pulvis-pyrius CBS 109.77 TaxID=1314802 RepID=A0A6A6WPK4_9PLEO|nr:hypothetical protein K505DRAFT_319108 [Melanomma pulvis-pyrius CBS 109.77]
MKRQTSWLVLLLAFITFLSTSLAASPTSFCKCTCFGNSTIVPLDLPFSTLKPSPDLSKDRASKKTCNDCNRQYCLTYPFCKDEKEENIFTTCFQRDSAKDQAVVFVFIFATVGLLSYAAIRPWIDQWAAVSRNWGLYLNGLPVCGYWELDPYILMLHREPENDERTSPCQVKLINNGSRNEHTGV